MPRGTTIEPPEGFAMWPKLLRLVTTHPAWVGEHVQAYAGLVNAELSDLLRAWQRRLLWQALALAGLAVALALAGVALLLWAVTPTLDATALWVLWLVPAVPLLLAAICMWAAAGAAGHEASLTVLAEQWQADQALLRSLDPA
jgi:hypothetical protein